MGISRIASFKQGKDLASVLLICDGQKLQIKQDELATVDTSVKAVDTLTTAATAAKVKLPQIFIRKNADGSFAVATGHDFIVFSKSEK